mmetsp:Transcript_23463/g.44567  ORF Transcript_23463/g.44567 Transcript_23463/m.44567 type:complete len:677 (+) Transcript_23463:281-2311(+)
MLARSAAPMVTKNNGGDVSLSNYSGTSSLAASIMTMPQYKKRGSNKGEQRRRQSIEENESCNDDGNSTCSGNFYPRDDDSSCSSSSLHHRPNSNRHASRYTRRGSGRDGSSSTVSSNISHGSRSSRRSERDDGSSNEMTMVESILSHPSNFPIAMAQLFRWQKVTNFILLMMTASLFIMVHDELTKAQSYYSRETSVSNSTQAQLYSKSGEAVSDPNNPNRRLATSLDLGGGDCLWQPPQYEVPENIDFYKTLIAGYPSGDKRMIWLQMEALAGWPAKDEWDFAFIGMSNHPFIKANYPHHEGFWGWGSLADQTILLVPYIRRSMVEYNDVLSDMGYPSTWDDPDIREKLLYIDKTPQELWYEWRDLRVMDEVHWWGWFIDYWMEGGLLRDIFTHKKVTQDHWNELMIRPFYSREELAFDRFGDPNAVVSDTYDPHCAKGEISNGCAPVEVVSVDRLVDSYRGPAETAKIATALLSDSKTGDHVIAQQAWPCIWEELVEHRKGPKTIYDRPGKEYGYVDTEYNFSVEMLTEMLNELNRLITKYNGDDWNDKPTAHVLVELLMEHAFYLQMEVTEVKAGRRKLQSDGFLGPETREARRRLRASTNSSEALGDTSNATEKRTQTQQTKNIQNRFSDNGQREFAKKRRAARKARERRRARVGARKENGARKRKVKGRPK